MQPGRTVLFVSHNMGAVMSLCHTGIMLQNGSLIAHEKIEALVQRYHRSLEKVFAIDLNCR